MNTNLLRFKEIKIVKSAIEALKSTNPSLANKLSLLSVSAAMKLINEVAGKHEVMEEKEQTDGGTTRIIKVIPAQL